MTETAPQDPPYTSPEIAGPHSSEGPRRHTRRVAWLLMYALMTYVTAAYLLAPLWWNRYERRHPALDQLPNITQTSTHIPGDAINVAIVGTRAEMMQILVAARWYPADPLTLKSCLEIAEATVLKHPYETAPVSNLFLWGRKQDLAFEQPVHNNPRQRHHVRFWQSDKVDAQGRPLWAGAAIYDRGVELSHTTGQVTHRTDGNIDAEREYLFDDLRKTGRLAEESTVDDFHKKREGRNGGGDPWHTDGRLFVGVIGDGARPPVATTGNVRGRFVFVGEIPSLPPLVRKGDLAVKEGAIAAIRETPDEFPYPLGVFSVIAKSR